MRLVFAVIIVLLALSHLSQAPFYIVILIITGLLADIADGIIARHLHISTIALRRFDSNADQVFWLSILAGSYLISPDFYQSHFWQITLLILFEAACYLISYIRFRKEVATHAIASKAWALVLCATLIQVILTRQSTVLFTVCFYLGIATRTEIMIMLLLIRQWTNDIPTVYHAYRLRHHKAIKRNKLFNG